MLTLPPLKGHIDLVVVHARGDGGVASEPVAQVAVL